MDLEKQIQIPDFVLRKAISDFKQALRLPGNKAAAKMAELSLQNLVDCLPENLPKDTEPKQQGFFVMVDDCGKRKHTCVQAKTVFEAAVAGFNELIPQPDLSPDEKVEDYLGGASGPYAIHRGEVFGNCFSQYTIGVGPTLAHAKAVLFDVCSAE